MQVPTISSLNVSPQTAYPSTPPASRISALLSNDIDVSYTDGGNSVCMNLSTVMAADATFYTERATLVSPPLISPAESVPSSPPDVEESVETTPAGSKLVQEALALYQELISHRVEYLLRIIAQKWQETSGDPSFGDDGRSGDVQDGLSATGGTVSLDRRITIEATFTDPDFFSPEKTAARIVDFALSFYTGGDRAAYASKIKAAVMKGFDQAKAAFGGVLPGVCYDTITLAVNAIDEWAGGGLYVTA